jgi:hypothetical protein
MLSSRFCMTHFKPRFGGAFFALRKARCLPSIGTRNPAMGPAIAVGWLGVSEIIAWAGLGCGSAWPFGSGRPSR